MRQQKDDALTEIEHGIAENADAGVLLSRLNALEAGGAFPDPVPAAVLRARAILQNRLGLPENAVLLLSEARQREDDPDAWKTSRELATIYAWRGDVHRANTELIRAMAEAEAGGRADVRALFFADAGRVCMERGDPETGARCFAAALKGMKAGEREQVRAAIGHIQCLNWIEDYVGAGAAIERLAPHIEAHNARLRQLFGMERARQRHGVGDAPGTCEALAQVEALLPEDPGAWEHVEFAQVRFELQQGADTDPDHLRDVIERLNEDQLYIQEAIMRLALADVLKARGELDEAINEASRALAIATKLNNQRFSYKARTALMALSDEAHPQDDTGLADLPLSARYVRASRIGKGGYGSVYKAVDTTTGRMVAIKVIALEGVHDPQERRARLADVRRELETSRTVSSANVARVLETYTGAGELAMVQEFIAGGELDEALVARLERPRLLTLLSQVAFGLASLHSAGIVHRDVKPQNILVRGDGTPVIVDFGLAGLAGEREDDRLRGTREYMAPELLRGGNRVFSPACDAFAFGVMLAWALGDEERRAAGSGARRRGPIRAG